MVEWADEYIAWIAGVLMGTVVLVVVAVVLFSLLPPSPVCPDGTVLAGGGSGGRYHCVPGAEPVYQ